MEKGDGNNYTPIKPLESSLTLEENEHMEFKLSKLEKVVESVKGEIKEELDAFKYDLHSIKGDILNYLRFLHTFKSSTQEEDNENKNVESRSHIGKIEAQLEKKRFDSSTFDHSSLQDPHFHGFNSGLRNYFIPKINMSMFDDKYPLTWIL